MSCTWLTKRCAERSQRTSNESHSLACAGFDAAMRCAHGRIRQEKIPTKGKQMTEQININPLEIQRIAYDLMRLASGLQSTSIAKVEEIRPASKTNSRKRQRRSMALPNANRKWDDQSLKALEVMSANGMSDKEIATQMGRSEMAITRQRTFNREIILIDERTFAN